MAATADIKGNKYWFEGLPIEGIDKSSPNDMGTEKFWFEGMPGPILLPAVVSSLIKSFNGLTQASTKSVYGLAIASIKSRNELSNV